MSKEAFPGNAEGFDPFNDGVEFFPDAEIELFLRKESMAPAMAKVIDLLRKAVHSDEAIMRVDTDRTRWHHIRDAALSENYPFVHDRLVLTPKEGIRTGVARKELRYAVGAEDSTNIRPKFIFITDYAENGELVSESIMTETTFGWYDDDVSLETHNGYIVDVRGLKHEEDFDPKYYKEILSYYELTPQSNDIDEAA